MTGSYFAQVVSWCGCGKGRYYTRSAARRAAKAKHPGEHLTAYRCGEFWHLGHLPAATAYGEKSRWEVYGRG